MLVAECMHEQGFEYYPGAHEANVWIDYDFDEAPQQGTLEYAQQYGFGVSNSPALEYAASRPKPFIDEVDQNLAYVTSLSPSESEAYEEALWGPPLTDDERFELQESGVGPDPNREGCQGFARHEMAQRVSGSEAAFQDPAFAELYVAMGEMHSSITDASRKPAAIADLDAEWSSCMSDAGHVGFASPFEAMRYFNENINVLKMTLEGDEQDEGTREQLEALSEEEIEAAVADLHCRDQVDYDALQQQTLFALEAEFVEKHKATLDAMILKYATSPNTI